MRLGLLTGQFGPDIRIDFDLILEATEQEQGLALSFIYSTDLFDENYIRCMADHFKTLIDSAVSEPNRPIANLPRLYLGRPRRH